jgi:hypothetical protein
VSNLSEKTTIYLSPPVKKFIQQKAIAERRSVSDIINDSFEDMLEDLEDIREVEKRRGQSSIPFEDVLKDMGLTFNDLRC